MQPPDMLLTDLDEVRAVVAERTWTTADTGSTDPGRVGLEVEHFVVRTDSTDAPAGRVALSEIRSVLDAEAALTTEPAAMAANPGWRLADGSRLVPEPGAQMEHVTLPAASVAEALSSNAEAVALLAGVAERQGWALASCGLDPWHHAETVGQQLDSPRYPAMWTYLQRRSPHGHTMMCHSASIQVNLDLGPPEVALQRWRVAHLAAPLAIATFACSPVPGAVSGRAVAWQWLDPTRTGIPAAFVEGIDDPVEVATRAALAADVLLVRRDGVAHPGIPGRTFSEWLTDGDVEHGPATRADLAYHLTTMFPEVRVRGFLELRSVDALPARWRPVPVVLYAGLLYDERARQAVEGVLERERGRLPALLHRATHLGVADPELCALAVETWTLAAAGARRLPSGYVDPADLSRAEAFLDRFTLRGRCPGDELRERTVDGPRATLAWARESIGSLTLC